MVLRWFHTLLATAYIRLPNIPQKLQSLVKHLYPKSIALNFGDFNPSCLALCHLTETIFFLHTMFQQNDKTSKSGCTPEISKIVTLSANKEGWFIHWKIQNFSDIFLFTFSINNHHLQISQSMTLTCASTNFLDTQMEIFFKLILVKKNISFQTSWTITTLRSPKAWEHLQVQVFWSHMLE